jgi:hypothetical protein
VVAKAEGQFLKKMKVSDYYDVLTTGQRGKCYKTFTREY